MPQQQGSGVGGGGGDVNGVLSWLPLLVSGLVVAHLLAFVSFVSFAPVPYGRLFSPLSLSLVELGSLRNYFADLCKRVKKKKKKKKKKRILDKSPPAVCQSFGQNLLLFFVVVSGEVFP